MMYQFLDIASRLPYSLFESLEAQRNKSIDAPQIESEKQYRNQNDYRGAPHIGAIRPGSLAHLQLHRREELGDPPERPQVDRPGRAFACFGPASIVLFPNRLLSVFREIRRHTHTYLNSARLRVWQGYQ